ncbi:hypothetical protein GWI33_008742 [Rhynchophorus ferrugineus]|uniref:Uncharacterized protein n=1 Tax=Rhynchophorus ferrugineus TaxID=354439 RepID=A0A834IHS0_RHYFE|nr:hypothetical protein GWI33_008742 [Rhynchophorus ferrugineus]
MHHSHQKDFVSSSSEIEKKVRSLRKSQRNVELEEWVEIASDKLDPIMEMLLDNPNNYDQYLSLEQYEEAIDAAGVIKQIIKTLEFSNIKTNVKYLDFELERYNVNVNENDRIFVDTIMLIQLIDLYNVLADIKIIMKEMTSTTGVNTIVQTESLYSIQDEHQTDPNKIILSLKEPLADDGSSLIDSLQREYFVFPSITDVNARDGKAENQTDKINDLYNANKVVIKCIYNLQEVSKYLGLERKDVSTVCSMMQVGGEERRRESSDKCSCADCLGSKENGHECDDDKIIICIKGRSQDEGDVKIVIRQCPECKKNEDKTDSSKKADALPVKSSASISRTKTSDSRSASSSDKRSSIEKEPKPEKRLSTESEKSRRVSAEKSKSVSIIEDKSDVSHHELEPGETSESEQDDEAKNESEPEDDIVDPEKSKESILSKKESDSEKKLSKKDEGPEDQQDPRLPKYSNINMFQTTNLCLETDTGQELVISLRVTPKDFEEKKLSLRDIFSEEDSFKKDQKEPAPDAAYFLEEHVIPLERTKVCSSLDFDVSVADSKIREQGIKNKNPKIVVKLNDFGIDNLLRACRPAKCCRKSILNEKMKKSLPYPASLRSLPLDDSDINVINESLQMSLQKVKNSTNLKKDYILKDLAHVNQIHTVMYFYVEHCKTENLPKSTSKQNFNYYINLVRDVGTTQPKSSAPLEQNSTKENRKCLDVGIVEVVTPNRWTEHKYTSYEDRPILTRHNIMERANLFSCKSDSKNKSIDVQKDKKKKQKQYSKIPVLQKKTGKRSMDLEADVYDISLSSLPREDILDLSQQTTNIPLLKSDLPKPKPMENKLSQSPKPQELLTRSMGTSRYSMISAPGTIKKHRKKKTEYCSNRSKSETSLKTVSSSTRYRTGHKYKAGWPRRKSKLFKEDIFKGEYFIKKFFDHISGFLYDMIMERLLNDSRLEDFSRSRNHHVQASKASESFSGGYDDANLKKLHMKPSAHHLKAKMSQSCFFYALNGGNSRFLLANLAIQTSKVFSTNRYSQTSQTFVAYHVQGDMDRSFRKNKLFSKQYPDGELNGIRTSCDQFENFIVVFKSTQSLTSEREFPCSKSANSLVSGRNVEESLSSSLLKLKETLERYEQVKKEMTQEGIQEGGLSAIEYFVYQMCACNKFQKKPSVFKRILSKTKGLLSSVDLDFCKKFQKPSFPSGKEYCRLCGCRISKCDFKDTDQKPRSSCSCPSDNKLRPPKKESQSFCQNMTQSKKSKSLSKVTSRSLSKLGSCIKHSLSNISNKKPSLQSCNCSTSPKIKKIKSSVKSQTFCIPKDVSIQICKSDFAKDTSTQKCDCKKCTNYAEDGTCCCSHCAGCLDKYCDIKPENNDVSTSCKCSKALVRSEKQKDHKDDGKDVIVMEALSDQSANDALIVERSDVNESSPESSTIYYLLGPQALCPDMRMGNDNPFCQYLLNIPSMTR